MRRYVLSVLVKNSSGVLARIAGLFSRRGYNIESITAGKTEKNNISRMTITLMGDEEIVEQLEKQLSKLEDVIKIKQLNTEEAVYRELVLIKVSADESKRSAISEIVKIFRSKIIDISANTLTIELTGDESKISALIKLMKDYGIKEMARTGLCALERGENYISDFDID